MFWESTMGFQQTQPAEPSLWPTELYLVVVFCFGGPHPAACLILFNFGFTGRKRILWLSDTGYKEEHMPEP